MFKLNDVNGVKFMTIESFEKTLLVAHGFSTRVGGVSTGEASSLNLGIHRKDTPQNVQENFRLLCNAAGLDKNAIVMTDQVHGDNVHVAKRCDIGKRIAKTDALITNEKGVVLCTFHADCIPIFFLDPVKKAIGLAHCGWRGTRLKIGVKVVEKMKAEYGCRPEDILVGIGPSIGVCHFEVDRDVADLFDEKYVQMHQKPHIDLRQMCRDDLQSAGIRPDNITVSDICTYCSRDLFFSYRGDNMKTGSMASVMQLLEG
jgi:YfiH family protein